MPRIDDPASSLPGLAAVDVDVSGLDTFAGSVEGELRANFQPQATGLMKVYEVGSHFGIGHASSDVLAARHRHTAVPAGGRQPAGRVRERHSDSGRSGQNGRGTLPRHRCARRVQRPGGTSRRWTRHVMAAGAAQAAAAADWPPAEARAEAVTPPRGGQVAHMSEADWAGASLPAMWNSAQAADTQMAWQQVQAWQRTHDLLLHHEGRLQGLPRRVDLRVATRSAARRRRHSSSTSTACCARSAAPRKTPWRTAAPSPAS